MKKPVPIRTVRFRYSQAPDYKVCPVTGAWGGLAGNGTVQVDLVLERQAPPKELLYSVVEEALQEEQRVPVQGSEKLMERIAQVGLLMSPESARAIGQWLIHKAEEWDKLTSSADGSPEDEEGSGMMEDADAVVN